MSETPSTMLELGTKAPNFSLTDVVTNDTVSLSDFEDSRALLVIFMCNHCPYVKNIKEALVDFANEYEEKGLAVVAISSNDVENYPDDSPKKMVEDAEKFGYPFPYLYDETQEVAKAYKAACTPDFFLFNEDRELVYRGQFDDSRPGNNKPVTGKDMREAVDKVLEDGSIIEDQKPSMGCNIKWKKGKEPAYFG
ncbi:thioredoxin family protein [Aliifodinibius sp. S!AR15-10]|uniref:thioredoxin family protein n=1 Tax=Aliifodinibius sp. S!AR15-10 TaxID=2950437 RepID=UPI00285C5DB5|nr:thioredoxin family protein [Aliifodinibius sp. S!AR15-10]MDR8393544.1 thioredoxin family protein [Aliifodinibius sp. S!AR15-10]